MLRAGLARRARRRGRDGAGGFGSRGRIEEFGEGRTHDRGELLVDGFPIEVRLLQEGNRLVVGGFWAAMVRVWS